MQGGRSQQTMPEDRTGWHQIDAGPHLEVLFHPNRRPGGREPDEIVRPSIVVAVAGKREQALRFDPFSMGAHYHLRPGLAEQIPLQVAEGQTPLESAQPDPCHRCRRIRELRRHADGVPSKGTETINVRYRSLCRRLSCRPCRTGQ
jgi:hypothetical protein